MSTATVEDLRPDIGVAGRHDVTFARIVNSEWIKFRTLRSSWIVLLAGMAALIGIALLIGADLGPRWDTLSPDNATPSVVLQGYFLAQLLIGVLGVLFVSAEYGTGMVRSTMAAVPRRGSVVAAKALVFGGIALATMSVASIVGFLGAQGLLAQYHHGVSLGDSGVLRVVLGTGAYLAMIGLLGAALGWILRNTAAGISGLVTVVLIVPIILGVLPGSVPKTVAEYLPAGAGNALTSTLQTPYMLSPGAGFAVLLGWVVGAMLLATVLVKRRDA